MILEPLVLFKALSEDTRLKSMLLMHEKGELCVCDLMSALSLSQPKVSRHLAELRKHQLVIDQRRGKWIYYQINPNLPLWVIDILNSTLAKNPATIELELTNLAGTQC